MNPLVYASRSLEQLEKDFQTSFSKGLAAQTREVLFKKRGPNGIGAQKLLWPRLLMRQFKSPFIYLLAGSAFISFFLESKINATIILAILLFNGLISFFQEYRASRALELLQTHLERYSTVFIDGIPQKVLQKSLVVGDIVLLDAGNYVPADVRILKGQVLVDESLLSGESLPIKKDTITLQSEAQSMYEATTMAFLGTTVVSGSARALVVATGKDTLFGEVSSTTLQSIQESGFQERLRKLSTFLLIVIGSTVPFLFLVQLLVKGSRIDLLELVLFSLALVIGLTPEALPTVTTFALSKGAVILAEHHVIVKRLSAIEDLGSITLLCTDKTGTLTENTLKVASWYEPPDTQLKVYAQLISVRPKTDPFDEALVMGRSPSDEEQVAHFTQIDEQPFDPEKRLSAVLVKKDEYKLLIVRGALDDIFRKCQNSVTDKARDAWIAEQALAGNRVLAMAVKQEPSSLNDDGLTFAGLISFTDPVKPTAVVAIGKAQQLGIRVKMITGDSKEVGCHVAQKIGLSTGSTCAISGEEFEELTAAEKKNAAQKYDVFARFLPAQKYRLVELLREGDTVGFLGDGINDAPALKAAHVGLVVQNASDITKEAADIILLRKSLLSIVDGIAIGRNVFANTLKYIITSIASNFGNFYSIALASLFIDFLPLLPRQILLINILSDFPMVALATDTVDPSELQNPPHYTIKDIALITTVLGVVSSVFDFMFFAFFYHAAPVLLQTAWFIESLLTEIVLIFSLRTRLPFYKAQRPSSTLVILCCVSVAVAVALPFTSLGDWLFHFTKPSWKDLATVSAIVLSYFIVTDLCKLAYYSLLSGSQELRLGKKHSSKATLS